MEGKIRESSPIRNDIKERRDFLGLGSLGALAAAGVALTQTAQAQSCVSPCYPLAPGETSTIVTNTGYPPGDLRRYGADVSGVVDSTSAINNALACRGGGTGFVFHPGGTITHASMITVPSNISIVGVDRSNCVFSYTGTGSAWSYVNGPNSSGYAMVRFTGICIKTTNASNVGAAIEINAGGWSYFEIDNCWLTGKFKYGLILDAVEICSVHNNVIDTWGPSNPIQIWIVNGSDRVGGQGTGYSNVITIRENQLSGSGGYGLIDDGGNRHTIVANNFDGHTQQAKFAGVTSLVLSGNSFETHLQTGTFNIAFTTLGVFGALKGPCTNGVIQGNTFAGNMSSGDCILTAAAKHTSFHITGNFFESVFGRGSAVNTTYLGNSFVGYNYDAGNSSMSHYAGVTNNADGNTLLPPQNGSVPAANIPGPTYGDTRYPHLFYGGVGIGSTAAPSALSGIARLFVDTADGDLKVRFSNGTVKTLATD